MAQLVVALDVPDATGAEQTIDALYELDCIYKIGLEALYGYGERILAYCEARDVRTFLDVKVHDIPRTAAAAVRALVRLGVQIVNVHALGGVEMMRAAVEAARERAGELGVTPPLVFAVTLLTSLAAEDLGELGLQGGPAENAMRLAALARDAGCDGVICSAQEVRDLKAFFGRDFLTLTPGIRPAGDAYGDQKRVATPADAVRAGADYLVVGRPILAAADPHAAARAILTEMRAAEREMHDTQGTAAPPA
jgi:orotidine-5'-phosphate decarboxylase